MTGIWDDLLVPSPKPPRPMLAEAIKETDFQKLKFPFLASAKIDGYRGIYWQGNFYTRSGKEHPSPAVKALAKKLQEAGYPDLDGELIVPDENFHSGGGKLREHNYSGPVEYIIYDVLNDELPFLNRWELYSHLKEVPGVKVLAQVWLENQAQLLDFENTCLHDGFEGVVIRKPSAKYKHGRGTLNDQIMLKLKRFHTAEAKVLALYPRMHNENPMTQSPLGFAERSTAQAGLVETNVLGKLDVIGLNGPYKGKTFSIGTFDGLTEDEKIQILRDGSLKGKTISYKYFPTGAKDKPRHPVYLCLRPSWDLDQGEQK